MKIKKISSKSVGKSSKNGRNFAKKRSELILLRKVNNIDKLFTKKDIKNIVDSFISRNQI